MRNCLRRLREWTGWKNLGIFGSWIHLHQFDFSPLCSFWMIYVISFVDFIDFIWNPLYSIWKSRRKWRISLESVVLTDFRSISWNLPHFIKSAGFQCEICWTLFKMFGFFVNLFIPLNQEYMLFLDQKHSINETINSNSINLYFRSWKMSGSFLKVCALNVLYFKLFCASKCNLKCKGRLILKHHMFALYFAKANIFIFQQIVLHVS